MKFIVAIILLISGLSTGFTQPVQDLEFWMARVAGTHVGMKRGEVERILPPKDPPRGGFTDTAQGLTYTVAPGYTVIVHYDYAGSPRDAHGKLLDRYSPDNRLLAPVRLRPTGASDLRRVMLGELDAALATKEAAAIAASRMEFWSIFPRGNIEHASPAVRDAKLALLLAALQKVDAASDKRFDPNDPENIVYLNMMPRPREGGIPEGYVSGMSPDSIKDPVVREDYKRMLALNADKAARIAPKRALYQARQDWIREVARFCRDQYGGGPHDTATIDRLVAVEIHDPSLKREFTETLAMWK